MTHKNDKPTRASSQTKDKRQSKGRKGKGAVLRWGMRGFSVLFAGLVLAFFLLAPGKGDKAGIAASSQTQRLNDSGSQPQNGRASPSRNARATTAAVTPEKASPAAPKTKGTDSKTRPSPAATSPKTPEGKSQTGKPTKKEAEGALKTTSVSVKDIPLPVPGPFRQVAFPVKPEKAGKEPVTEDDHATALAHLKPLLTYAITSGEKEKVRQAIRKLFAGQVGEARALAKKLKDPAARKLVTWYDLRRSTDAPWKAVANFHVENPLWPSRDLFRRRAERQMFRQTPKAQAVLTYFQKNAPVTAAGELALIQALLATGKTEEAEKRLRTVWRERKLSPSLAATVIERFGKRLTEEDHRARLRFLLHFPDRRSREAARKLATRFDKTVQKHVSVALALLAGKAKARKRWDTLPEVVRQQPEMAFALAVWLRKKKRYEAAWQQLLSVPVAKRTAHSAWWREQRILCRVALNQGKPGIAYRLASSHGPLPEDDLKEASFLAGWIALRYRTDPEQARTHLTELRKIVHRGRDVAKAEYWLGRAAEEAGDETAAQAHYRAAASYPFSYYGLLARHKLPADQQVLRLPPTPKPSDTDVRRFRERQAVRALVIAHKSGLSTLPPLFFLELAWRLESPGELGLLAELASHLSTRPMMVRIGKIAVFRGIPLLAYAYPTDGLPAHKPLTREVETAFLYALARQESEFNPAAKSRVGARGLMQIMPRTARGIARRYGVKYALNRLTEDPTYNVMLGAAHLRDLMDNYDNAYTLTLVAYNAGPLRVRQWKAAFGDPRKPEVDAIDWVERIPFTETRQYVKRILASLQIYRARFGETEPLRLVVDVKRGHVRTARAE